MESGINIVRVGVGNYALYEDMVFFRMNGRERAGNGVSPIHDSVADATALPEDGRLYVYAAMDTAAEFLTGWISMVYIPKASALRWGGRGHIVIDELWVRPDYRGRGIAALLMEQADRLAVELNTHGIRLYTGEGNATALGLYEKCGFSHMGEAIFMEKSLPGLNKT